MNISTDYDYLRYLQYINQTSSTAGQQNVQPTNTNTAQDLLQVLGNPTQSETADKPKNPLDALVDSGTITSDQEKAIRDALEASRMTFQTQAGAANASDSLKNPLDSLVSAGTITEDQASAVKSTLQSAHAAHGGHHHRMQMPQTQDQSDSDNSNDPLAAALDNLVSSGTITKDQESAVKSAFQSAIEAYQTQSGSYEDTAWNSFDQDI